MQNYKSKLKNSGFSLLELLIYIAILAVVVVMISNIIFSLNKSRAKIEAESELNSNLRFSLLKIVQDIKEASSVSIPGTIGAASSTLQVFVSPNIVLYDVFDGRLRRTVDGGLPDIITSDKVFIQAPSFFRLENYNPVLNATTTGIQISLTMNYNSQSPDYNYSESVKTTASLR
ncbi:MAG: prepilin-type N-terminal cleavage/methylation domain-containing protein [Candidatus Terrybacteria bacterium]|nr:prepilin-type N-terminal cleavage/methylation domain-containing protein [Candidatus Terrybacteria bacterium]